MDSSQTVTRLYNIVNTQVADGLGGEVISAGSRGTEALVVMWIIGRNCGKQDKMSQLSINDD